MPHSRRTFVDHLDFRTTVGHGASPGDRGALGFAGAGSVAVVTDLGVLRPDPATHQLALAQVHPGVAVAEVRGHTAWPLAVAEGCTKTAPPTAEELAALAALEEAAP